MDFLKAIKAFAQHRKQALAKSGITDALKNHCIRKILLECEAFGHLPPHRQYHKVKELAPWVREVLPTNPRFRAQRNRIEKILNHGEAMVLPQLFINNPIKQ